MTLQGVATPAVGATDAAVQTQAMAMVAVNTETDNCSEQQVDAMTIPQGAATPAVAAADAAVQTEEMEVVAVNTETDNCSEQQVDAMTISQGVATPAASAADAAVQTEEMEVAQVNTETDNCSVQQVVDIHEGNGAVSEPARRQDAATLHTTVLLDQSAEVHTTQPNTTPARRSDSSECKISSIFTAMAFLLVFSLILGFYIRIHKTFVYRMVAFHDL